MDQYESEGEDAFDESGDEEQGFAIGTVVFPVDHQKDWVDVESVLISHADTYIGKYLGEFLSERIIGATAQDDGEEEEDDDEDLEEEEAERRTKTWKVIGTLADRTKEVPSFLWAVMRADDYEAYIKELIKCSVIIYDVTHEQSIERFAEIRAVVDALRDKSTNFKARRVFILISSLHSWSHTVRHPDPATHFSESDYRRRRTKPLYRELQLLERYVVASGKMTRGMLKAYVIGAGAVYGGEEFPLHQWFKGAWHNGKHLPIYGNGKNFMPTIYIRDLASIIQNVMDHTPRKQRYIIAVDPTVQQQDQIVKSISDILGTGRVKRVSEDEIYLNKELTTFQADQILLDVNIESTFCRDNFNIDWNASDGFTSIIRKLVAEYRKARNLTPLKVLVIGPPGSGKSTVARQVSDIYRLHHFTLQEMVDSTRQLLRDIAGEESEPDIMGIDMSAEEEERERAKNLLAEIDSAEVEGEPLPDSIIARIYRYRLLTNPCQNQGFILDGWPEKFDQARALFAAGDNYENEYEEEDEGEDILERMDYRLLPDRVFILEASDHFLKDRLGRVPLTQLDDRHQELAFEKSLAAYREANLEYDSCLQSYLDEQEIIYFPVDIAPDTSPSMQGTVTFICSLLGKPRNYGITREEEESLRNAQQFEQKMYDMKEREELALLETRELEERRKNIQDWMEKLAKVKKEEFQREESALIPLRMYLMAHIVPTLTKGLIDVTRARPDDPIDFLAEFLFQNNPGGINPSADAYLKQ